VNNKLHGEVKNSSFVLADLNKWTKLITDYTQKYHVEITVIVFLIINCRSIRSQNKRNELATLLLHYNIDIILGNESHIDSTFLFSELLPISYKIIRKDPSLGGGGGVFIGFRDDLVISELSYPSSEVEMIWVKLQIPNSKPLLYVFIL